MNTKKQTGSHCSCTPGPQAQSCGCSAGSPPEGEIGTVTSIITFANQLDHFLARWAWNRNGHRVEPGLYRLGNPITDSPVFASANYTLSFDALRSALAGWMYGSWYWTRKGSMSGAQQGRGRLGRTSLSAGSSLPVWNRLSATGRSSCPSSGLRVSRGRRSCGSPGSPWSMARSGPETCQST